MQVKDNSGDNRVSEAHDFFQVMFESADLYTSMWQPTLKSAGRWHLELAGLGVKQTQASFQLARDLVRCLTPADALSANVRFWDAVSSQYAQSSQRLAVNVSRAIESPLRSEVVQLPMQPVTKRVRDMIVIPDPASGLVRPSEAA